MVHHPKRPRDTRFCVAIVISVSILIAAGAIVWLKWDAASRAQIGEWGSLISGVASAVALVWLVVAYLQQGEELRHQLKEFAASVEAQKRQAIAAEEAVRLAIATSNSEAQRRLQKAPRFNHQIAYLSNPEYGIVDLLLSGDDATNIHVRATADNITVQVSQEDRARIERGKSMRLYVKPVGSGVQLGGGSQFEISYLDPENNAFRQIVMVDWNKKKASCEAPIPSI